MALVLTRRIDETIKIGDDVSLTILGIQGSQVRIGIDAPREIAVHRQEIWDKIQLEKGDDHGIITTELSAEQTSGETFSYTPERQRRAESNGNTQAFTPEKQRKEPRVYMKAPRRIMR